MVNLKNILRESRLNAAPCLPALYHVRFRACRLAGAAGFTFLWGKRNGQVR
jgi:hypothetical protein